jgi:hypothetical protein
MIGLMVDTDKAWESMSWRDEPVTLNCWAGQGFEYGTVVTKEFDTELQLIEAVRKAYRTQYLKCESVQTLKRPCEPYRLLSACSEGQDVAVEIQSQHLIPLNCNDIVQVGEWIGGLLDIRKLECEAFVTSIRSVQAGYIKTSLTLRTIGAALKFMNDRVAFNRPIAREAVKAAREIDARMKSQGIRTIEATGDRQITVVDDE